MYAIIETGGKQYRVSPGTLLDVEKLNPDSEVEFIFDSSRLEDSSDSTQESSSQSSITDNTAIGAGVVFRKVLCVGDGEDVRFGLPYVEQASVSASVVEQRRSKKISMIKLKRRKHHMKRLGHRQSLTRVRIHSIQCS